MLTAAVEKAEWQGKDTVDDFCVLFTVSAAPSFGTSRCRPSQVLCWRRLIGEGFIRRAAFGEKAWRKA